MLCRWYLLLTLGCGLTIQPPKVKANIWGDLEKGHRYGDLLSLALMKAADPRCNAGCQALWLRNAGRAAMFLGDYESSLAYLRLSQARVETPDVLPLIAYIALISYDETLWRSSFDELSRKVPTEIVRYKVLQTIEGPERFSAASLSQARHLAGEVNDRGLKAALQRYAATDYKSPTAAGVYGLFPGGGFAYLGQWESALKSFFLVGLSGWATHEFARQDLQGPAVAAGLVTSVFYLGGIFASVRSAVQLNERESYQVREDIRAMTLPALQFEWTEKF